MSRKPLIMNYVAFSKIINDSPKKGMIIMFKQTLTVALMTSFAACGSADGEWKVSGGWTSFSEKDELLEARTFCGKHRRGGAVGSVLPMQDICLSFVNGKALYTDAEHTTFESNDKGSYD